MSSTKNQNCPICKTCYSQNQRQCSQCSWDLTLYNDRILSAEQLLKVHISARKIYRYLEKYRDTVEQMQQKIQFSQKREDDLVSENDRLKQEIERLEILPLQISELKSQINKLQKDVKQLEAQKDKNEIKDQENLQQYVINQYHHNINFFTKNGIQVTPTKQSLEDIYFNTIKEIVFKPISSNYDYWIVELESKIFCLLPNQKLTIKRNLKAIKSFFELRDYRDNSASNWRVIKLANVEQISIDRWKFKSKGILQF